jgi:hypothetical protein
LPHAPDELTRTRLRRLGEGVGKVVYASEHWVVKRERSPSEIVALIVVWRILRKLERMLPGAWGQRLVQRPARQIRWLRVAVQGVMRVVPRAVWFTTHVRDVWKVYHSRNVRGEQLAAVHLEGTDMLPARVTFPPVCVTVGGWPGQLTVSEATERVEATLYQRVTDLARAGRFEDVQTWLDRFLDFRQTGWEYGLFSVDAHLKNYGVLGDRIVLLDPGGLTNRWTDVERRLSPERSTQKPHVDLGLEAVLASRPDIAERFNSRWNAVVNPATIRKLWDRAS